MKHSLQLKLVLSFALIIIVLVTGALVGISVIVKDHTVEEKKQELTGKGSALAAELQILYEQNSTLSGLDAYLAKTDSYLGARIWVLDESRRVVSMSVKGRGPGWRNGAGTGTPGHNALGSPAPGAMRAVFDDLDFVFAGNIWSRVLDNPDYGEKMLVAAIPITAENQVIGALLIQTSSADIDFFLEHIYYYIGVTGLLAVLLSLVALYYVTRNIIGPLTVMQGVAGAMEQGNYSVRVEVKTSDEVGRLGLAINSLAAKLARYITELDHMEKVRRDFVANISHELKTPITVIRGYLEALIDGTADNPAAVQKYHLLMRNETLRLENLIHDSLDLSRLQSVRDVVFSEKIPLATVADSVVQMMRQRSEQKQVTLISRTKGSLPEICGDGERLTQLLLILVDNALKYTPPGGSITVSTATENNSVVLAVTDTGIGIPADDLPLIWERFYKVDKSHSRNDSGTGLGLAIAKQIIELHQAKVSVFSQRGQGTTITVIFPMP